MSQPIWTPSPDRVAASNLTAFIDALNAIRGTKLACEYLIPAPPPGEKLDFNKVNVEHTPPGAAMPER